MDTNINTTTHIRHDYFNDIEYDRGIHSKKNSPLGKKLGGHFVQKWIFEEAWSKFSNSILTANKGEFHSAQDLFNDDATWYGYEKSIRIAIGRCLAYFVANKMLPLACVNPDRGGKLLYTFTEAK